MVQQIKRINSLSLATLQSLYLRYFKEDASQCNDVRTLVRKLQYWLQKKNFKYHNRTMSAALAATTREVLNLSIQEEVMGKGKKGKGKKGTKKVTKQDDDLDDSDDLDDDDDGPETTDDDDSDDSDDDGDDDDDDGDDDDDDGDDDDSDDDDGDDDDDASDDDGDDSDDSDDDGDEDEGEPEPATGKKGKKDKKKRTAPGRTGSGTVVRLRKQKFKISYVYEAIVQVLAANRKLKAIDGEIADAIQKAFPTVNYKKYRVEADRKKYNKGLFKGQPEGGPERKSVAYNEDGSVLKRVVPEQLRPQVEKTQKAAKAKAAEKAEAEAKASKKGKKGKKGKKSKD